MSVADAWSLSQQLRDRTREAHPWARRLHVLAHQFAAALLLLLLAPLMAWVACMTWRHDGAPVLFGHYRVTPSPRFGHLISVQHKIFTQCGQGASISSRAQEFWRT